MGKINAQSIVEVRNDFFDTYDKVYCIDCYTTFDEEDDTGFCACRIDMLGNIQWLVEWAKDNGLVQEAIMEVQERIKKEQNTIYVLLKTTMRDNVVETSSFVWKHKHNAQKQLQVIKSKFLHQLDLKENWDIWEVGINSKDKFSAYLVGEDTFLILEIKEQKMLDNI